MKLKSILSASLALVLSSSAAAQGGVPRALLHRLHSGVNITRWFCYLPTGEDWTQHFKSYLVEQDWDNFRKLGIDYVRLCVSPEAIYANGMPNAKNLPALDAALRLLTRHGLAVLLDLHDNGQMNLDKPNHDNRGFISFWKAMASHYRGRYEKRVVFELLNEPIFYDNGKVWLRLQEETVKAIRTVDRKRTLMVSANRWSGVDSFKDFPKLPQANLLYTFHCYDPFFFTHQGASWVGAQPRDFKHVPFPSSPDAVEGILKDNDPANHEALRWYGKERYDAANLAKRIEVGAKYARANKVPVLLGEFGAYPPVSPPEARAEWFRAMKAAVTKAKVPYCIWGYDDGLGLGRSEKNGRVTLDPVTLRSFYGR